MNIVISGTVGVGKSTISNKLKEILSKKYNNVILNKEIGEFDPILDVYYSDRPSWSFIIQIKFVLDRFKRVFTNSSKENINIFDRHFLDDFIIASMPMIKEDMSNLLWESYHNLNIELTQQIKNFSKVDYLFLLKADFSNVIKRVQTRGRISEKQVDIEYWKNMYEQYYENKQVEEYIKNNVENVILIDVNKNNIDEIVFEIIKAIDL